MEEHCKNCVADGRFVGKFSITKVTFVIYLAIEAEISKNRLRELKEQEFGMEYQNLVFQHQQRKEDIQSEHLQQYNDFNNNYNMEFQKASEEDQMELDGLEARHNQQLAENRASLEETLPLTFKFSTELLNLKKITETLGKQKDYQEAHTVQTKANQIFEKERKNYMEARHKKIMAAEAKLMQRQLNEMNALRKKL